MIDPHTFRLHRNDNFQRHRNVINNRPNEEKFGKLKFSMPKFEDTSEPDAYLTWELKVEKIFCVHNYSEEKVHMAAHDGYALIFSSRTRRRSAYQYIKKKVGENTQKKHRL